MNLPQIKMTFRQVRKEEDLCTTTSNDETDRTKCLASLSKSTPFNPGVQSTKPTAKSKLISLIAATRKSPNKMHRNYTASLRCIVPPSASSSYRYDPSLRLCSAAHVFMLSAPGEELGFCFGIWRRRNECWSILVDQLLTTI